MAELQILLGDDHTLVRQGVRKIIEEQSGWRIVSEVRTTVETHRAHILQKLDVHNAAELVLDAVRRGVIS